MTSTVASTIDQTLAETATSEQAAKKPFGKAASRRKEDMKAAYYDTVLDSKSYEEKALKPLMQGAADLAHCAMRIGQADATKTRIVIGDKEVDRHTLNSLIKTFNDQIRELKYYHEQVLKYGKPPKKGKKASTDNGEKSQNATFNMLWKYDARLGEFFKEAAANNSDLASWAELNVCKPGEYFAVAPQKFLTTLINSYIRANGLACPNNGNMIVVDRLMRKHLGKEIDEVLAYQHKVNPEDAEKYEGMIRRVRFSSVWPKLRLKEEETKEKVAAALKDPKAKEMYQKDFAEASQLLTKLREKNEAARPAAKDQEKGPRATPASIRERVQNDLVKAQKNLQQGLPLTEGLKSAATPRT